MLHTVREVREVGPQAQPIPDLDNFMCALMAATCSHERATSEPQKDQGTPRRPSEAKYRFLIL